jgi:hypothetical protein
MLEVYFFTVCHFFRNQFVEVMGVFGIHDDAIDYCKQYLDHMHFPLNVKYDIQKNDSFSTVEYQTHRFLIQKTPAGGKRYEPKSLIQ